MAVLVALEGERILALGKQREFLDRERAVLELVRQVGLQIRQAMIARRDSDGMRHQSSPWLRLPIEPL